jgi:2-keto-4-pentenoate hydratase/2-oxohepta-3-ene-1,7-dioic acid hydratase in catechol pathway
VFSRFVRFDGNLEALRLELLMNGQLAQQGGTPLMLFKPAAIAGIDTEFYESQ